ncbi:DeoR faimly transcriptional regulator [Salmonella enterica subsp. enterica]|uniref:DeoR faimly transcriptional regulator n=1 Tax=Salmonella enterica I TaxID=59201 RepID=A0A379V2L6_SALET|nr:DeoR faimly transcriptional regulator [Salmonella enterica subsp. enterica]
MTRRADRLFQIVQILRGRRLTTAALLAQRLAVSERTIYRDIRDLSLSGVPVEGEAGSGYRLMAGFDLPPLMLTHRESEALMVAIRLLKTWGGDSLSRELESAQEKVLAILPEESRRKAEQTRIYAPDLGTSPHSRSAFDLSIRPFRRSRCWRYIIVMKRGISLRGIYNRWDCFSGESTGCWLPGVRDGKTIGVFASIAVYKLLRLTGDFVKQSTVLCVIFCEKSSTKKCRKM